MHLYQKITFKTMKKKISLTLWLSVLLGGIWQCIKNIFSWKNKTPFWRVVWATITVCLVALTCGVGYEIYKEYQREYRWVQSEPISYNLRFTRPEYSRSPGWIANKSTNEVITKNVDWVKVSADEDSLAVFSSKGKRGYLNRYSGKIAIQPQYDKAWIFSSGVAGVVKDNKVFFIDHSGKPINDKSFVYNPRNNYVYHGNYCIMNDGNDMLGLIDRAGNWAIEPTYDWICHAPHNYWKMRKGYSEDGLWYAYTDKAELVNELGVMQLDVAEDIGVIYTLPNHLKMVIDFDGNRVEKFLCRDIEAMYYDTDQRDTANNFIPAKCTLYRYRMDDGYEGLCNENGDIVTEPLYWNVQPISKDLYHCTYRETNVGVIINSKGERTEC